MEIHLINVEFEVFKVEFHVIMLEFEVNMVEIEAFNVEFQVIMVEFFGTIINPTSKRIPNCQVKNQIITPPCTTSKTYFICNPAVS